MEERQNATRKIIERMKQDENLKTSEGKSFFSFFNKDICIQQQHNVTDKINEKQLTIGGDCSSDSTPQALNQGACQR